MSKYNDLQKEHKALIKEADQLVQIMDKHQDPKLSHGIPQKDKGNTSEKER